MISIHIDSTYLHGRLDRLLHFAFSLLPHKRALHR